MLHMKQNTAFFPLMSHNNVLWLIMIDGTSVIQ